MVSLILITSISWPILLTIVSKGLEVPFIYGRLGHGLNVESSKPLVAKVVYGALGKSGLNSR